MGSTAEKIRKAVRTHGVEVEDWGGTYYVRALPWARHREIWGDDEHEVGSDEWMDKYMTEVLLLGVCEQDGSPVWKDGEEVDALLETTSMQAVAIVTDAIMRACTPPDVEDAAKNSESVQPTTS